MRRLAVAALAAALMVTAPAPARACDPYWDWCGDDWWYDPYWDLPAYEEPSWTWWWDEPVYEPAPVYEPPPVYVPEPVYVPAPIYVPEPVYAPAPIYEPIPAYVPPPVYEPVTVAAPPVYVEAPAPVPAPPPPPPAPTWSDPVVWSAPGSDVLDAWVPPAPPQPPPPVALAPDPDAAAAALGLHRVTEVWTGHTTTTEGLRTTYASTSASLDAGTQARLVATVGTGQTTAYDPLVLGGRTTLSDGRAISGEIYENYVWNGYEWVVNGYVFFQDDSELARLTQIATPQPIPATVVPVTMPAPSPAAPAPVVTAPVATVPSAPASVTPLTGDIPVAPVTASPPAGTSQPVPRVVQAGIALAPQADPLGRVEVLRGRRVPLWVRATVDGVPARIVGWRLVSGEVTALGPISGGGDEPLVATWPAVTRPGTALEIRLRASVDVPGEWLREVDAAIEVVVRAPALVE